MGAIITFPSLKEFGENSWQSHHLAREALIGDKNKGYELKHFNSCYEVSFYLEQARITSLRPSVSYGVNGSRALGALNVLAWQLIEKQTLSAQEVDAVKLGIQLLGECFQPFLSLDQEYTKITASEESHICPIPKAQFLAALYHANQGHIVEISLSLHPANDSIILKTQDVLAQIDAMDALNKEVKAFIREKIQQLLADYKNEINFPGLSQSDYKVDIVDPNAALNTEHLMGRLSSKQRQSPLSHRFKQGNLRPVKRTP